MFKVILFQFFIAQETTRKLAPDENSFKSANREMTLYWGLFFGAIIIKVFYEIGLWEWLMNNWPIEYGRVHSKNFIAPTGVMGVGVTFFTWLTFKKYFSKKLIKDEIERYFNNEQGRDKAWKLHKKAVLAFFFNAFFAVVLACGMWKTGAFCSMFWICAELWVRRTFYVECCKH